MAATPVENISDEIRIWSKTNFGKQAGDGLVLGRVAPLLGLVEEVAEFSSSKSIEDKADAIGDALIFLIDYLTRAGFDPMEVAELFYSAVSYPVTFIGSDFLHVAVGNLCRCELKRVQGIRSFADFDFYRNKLLNCAKDVIVCLDLIRESTGLASLEDVLETVWSRVKRRDWRADPQAGGERVVG